MGIKRGFGEKDHGNSFAEAQGTDLHSLSQLVSDNSRNPNQMMTYYAGSLQVFNSVTPEEAQGILLIASAAEAASDPAPEMSKPPRSESSIHRILTSRSPPQRMLQHTDGNDLIYKLQTELPIARRNSLQRFLETRRERLVNRVNFTDNVPDGCSANESSTSSSSSK